MLGRYIIKQLISTAQLKGQTYRWFKSLNVSIASEVKQRKMAAEVIGQDPEAEMGAFTVTVDKGEEIREVPFVYFPNLIAKISDTIQQHERYSYIVKYQV